MKGRISAVLSLIIMILCMSVASADLEIRFIDVGQGDATLIQCDGEAMLIDGGSSFASQAIYQYIRKTVGLNHLDYIIATHPHDDHIGGLASALNAVPVDLLLTPVLEWDSKPFRNMIKYANKQGTVVSLPSDGDTLRLGSAAITILHVWPEAWTENDMSIVVRLEYGDFSAIFMADAESTAEYMILDEWENISSTLLKVGHHGSRTSTTDEFLRAVHPSYAVISCGIDNEYGHPHQETLNALKSRNIKTYRTDLNGDIIFRVNDGKIEVSVQYTADDSLVFSSPSGVGSQTEIITRSAGSSSGSLAGVYVLNTRTKKFHYAECKYVKDISQKNRKDYTGTREELINEGYVPCGNCNP